MTSLWAAVEPVSARRILLAAVDAFAAAGYHGAATRDIALRAGLSPAGVYAFYASKAELLETISTIGHEDALEAFRTGLDSGDAPGERVAGGVRALAVWHAENHKLARIVQHELGALPAPALARMRELRRQFVKLMQDDLQKGIEAGEFEIDDVVGTANALLSLCIDITRWYSPRSRYSPARLGDLYSSLAVKMISSPTT